MTQPAIDETGAVSLATAPFTIEFLVENQAGEIFEIIVNLAYKQAREPALAAMIKAIPHAVSEALKDARLAGDNSNDPPRILDVDFYLPSRMAMGDWYVSYLNPEGQCLYLKAEATSMNGAFFKSIWHDCAERIEACQATAAFAQLMLTYRPIIACQNEDACRRITHCYHDLCQVIVDQPFGDSHTGDSTVKGPMHV